MKGNLDPNKITKYWRNQKPPDLKSLTATNQKFTDPYFPPNRNSLISCDEKGKYIDEVMGPSNYQDMEDENPGSSTRLVWKRATELKPTWEVFEGKIEFNDVQQGSLGDCYFLSSITALAEFPYLIREKFRTVQFNKAGYYELILFIDGEWQIVFLDDYFPYDPKLRDFAYAKPHNNELWAILLEKAWAKVNGGFSNIIGGIVSEPISALTGFPTDYIKHEEIDPDDLYVKIEIADKEGTIMSSASKREDRIEKKGLVQGHAYTLIGAKQWKERKIRLLQLRNPWGEQEWKGDWSDRSAKWTDEYKKYFGFVDKNDGIFWIDIDNYVFHFDSTYICYLLYGAVIKNYYFEYERYFKAPVVFNIHITEQSKTSISVTFKNWRFNRDLHDPIHPFSMVLAKYDPAKQIEKLYSKWASMDDLNLIETLDAGYYVLWLYCPNDCIVGDKKPKYALSISSVKNFQAEFVGMDTNFLLIQELVIQNYKRTGSNNINSSKDYFLGSDRAMNTAGLSTLLIYNKTDKWLEIGASAKKISNVYLLPPYTNMTSISLTIPPKQNSAILGIRKSNKATEFAFSFSIGLKNLRKDIPKQSNVFDYFLRFDLKHNDAEDLRTGEYRYVARDKTNDLPSFNEKSFDGQSILKMSTMRIEEITENSLKKEYPTEMNLLLTKFRENPNDKTKKSWDKIPSDDGIYLGQIDSNTGNLEGRGVFIWTKKKIKYIGYWAQGKMSDNGILLDQNNKIIYEGEYKNGKRYGRGKLYVSEKEYYDGPFVDDKMEGRGVYHYANGDVWEGLFENNMKNGVGIMTYKATNVKYLVEFDKDNFMGKIDLEEKEKKEFDKIKEEEKKKQQNPINAFMGGLASMNKIVSDGTNKFAEQLYHKKTMIEPSIIVQKLDKEIIETPEQKKHREYIEKINDFKKKEPFMLEQLLELRNLGYEEDLQLIDINPQTKAKYLGGVINGKMKHGRGAYFDGNYYYIGYFNYDYPCGYFRKFGPDKNIVFKGILDQNFHIAQFGILYLPNGDRYKGNFLNEQINGFGTYYFAKGDSWTGTFMNGTFHGAGKYFYENGLLTETVFYDYNKVVAKQNLQREDYSVPGADYFFNTIKQRYPGVIEHLLLIPPMRAAEEVLKWALFNFPDGNAYIGQTKSDNTFHGRGCFVYLNGPIRYYIGYIENKMFSGKGTYYDANWKIIYDGDFENSKRHGFGKAFYIDGSAYVGQFMNDVPNGAGVLIFPNGSRYEGKFVNGEKNDKGYLINEHFTTKQEIEFKNGNVMGQGEIIQCTKSKYMRTVQKEVGCLQLVYAKKTKMFLSLQPVPDTAVLSRGTKDFVDGLYIGEMNTVGFRHGRGVLNLPHSKMFFVGYFYNNLKEGHGILYYDEDKPKYIGYFHNDKPYGRGKYFYENGETLEGEFNEVGEGTGIYTFADGAYWKGTFYAWTLNGTGEYYSKEAIPQGYKTYRLSQFVG